MSDSSRRPRDPSRSLSLFDLTCLGVNSIVGSSIFLFPGRLAQHLGPASVLAFGLTALLLAPVGLCFAEASSRFDRAGGPYLYARGVFGPWAGFGIGWMCWISVIFGWAAVANGIAVYLGHFGDAWRSPWIVKGIAAAVIASMGALNYRGVKLGAWTSNFFTAAKLVPLALFALVALPRAQPHNFVPFAPHGWKPLGPACFLAYFAFQGFENVPVPAGEAAEPKRAAPLAVLISLAVAAAVYMLVQAAAVGVHPGLAGSERPLADAAGVLLGPAGAALIVLGAAVSMIGFNAGSALGGPRYLVALAENADLPALLARRHLRFDTPHVAVAATAALTLAAAVLLDFDKLVDFSNVVICAQYVATCACVPLLRRRAGDDGEGFRLPGGWLVPIAGIAATAWLGGQSGFAEIKWSAALLAAGIFLRYVYTKTNNVELLREAPLN